MVPIHLQLAFLLFLCGKRFRLIIRFRVRIRFMVSIRLRVRVKEKIEIVEEHVEEQKQTPPWAAVLFRGPAILDIYTAYSILM